MIKHKMSKEKFIKIHARKFFWQQKLQEVEEIFGVLAVPLFSICLSSFFVYVIYLSIIGIVWPLFFIFILAMSLLFVIILYHFIDWILQNREKALRRAEKLWRKEYEQM